VRKPTCAVSGRAYVHFIIMTSRLQHFPTGHAWFFIDIQEPGYDETPRQAAKKKKGEDCVNLF